MTESELTPQLREHLDAVGKVLESNGAEPMLRAGVLRDLEGQIEEMRSTEGLSDAEILARLDPPDAYREGGAGSTPDGVSTPTPSQETKPPRPSLVFYFWLFSAVVALVAILVEAAEHICASLFFDPIPSWVHLFALLPVPFLVAVTAIQLRWPGRLIRSRWLWFGNGYFLLVSLIYVVKFLPMLHLAMLGVLWFGMGLLPLSPCFVLIAAIQQGRRLRRWHNRPGFAAWRWWLAGAAVVVLTLGGLNGWRYMVERAVEKALSGEVTERRVGVEALRFWHGEGVVLEECYDNPAPRSFLFHRRIVDVKGYQALYYRLTGKDYREVPRPKRVGAGRFNAWEERVLADNEVGGAEVGSRTPRLILQNAALDVSVTAAPDGQHVGPGVAYAELTLEFVNHDTFPREARCQIVLPPGGVASRLTLWIDGEEREAAYGRRGTVKEAYRQTAVVQRRDPALLTTAGPDRVLLQCFPVNPGVPMKVKVGFTLPMLPDAGQMALLLPIFSERNFTLTPGEKVSVWVESRTPLSANRESLRNERGLNLKRVIDRDEADASRHEVYVLRGEVEWADLPTTRVLAASPAPGKIYQAELSGVTAFSWLRSDTPMQERLAAMVLDTSARSAAWFRSGVGDETVDWRAVLARLPDGVKIALFAGALEVSPLTREEALRQWPELLAKAEFIGADDPIGNLEKAWDLSAATENGVVLWLHGSVPVELSSTGDLEQRLRRRPWTGANGAPLIISAQFGEGPNRTEEKLGQMASFQRLPVRLDLPPTERIGMFFDKLLYPRLVDEEILFGPVELLGKLLEAKTRITPEGAADTAIASGSPHIVRLVVAAEVLRKLQNNAGAEELATAAATAQKLRLVTPLTGAVVLENARQYAEHDLDPAANARNIPTIPEPEEWALLLIVLAIAAFLLAKKRSLGHTGGGPSA